MELYNLPILSTVIFVIFLMEFNDIEPLVSLKISNLRFSCMKKASESIFRRHTLKIFS